MKKALCTVLALCLLLSGCSVSGERDTVTFYYPRQELRYGEENGVIGSEQRDVSGHRDDLSYLLALYLIGPSEEPLVTPLPRGTRFLSVQQDGTTVFLTMTDTAQTMTDTEFTLACACLTLTCLSATGAETVNITSGSRTVTMSMSALTLFDDTAATEETK